MHQHCLRGMQETVHAQKRVQWGGSCWQGVRVEACVGRCSLLHPCGERPACLTTPNCCAISRLVNHQPCLWHPDLENDRVSTTSCVTAGVGTFSHSHPADRAPQGQPAELEPSFLNPENSLHDCRQRRLQPLPSCRQGPPGAASQVGADILRIAAPACSAGASRPMCRGRLHP